MKAEDFRIGQTLRDKGIRACERRLDSAETEEFVDGGRDEHVRLPQCGFVLGPAGRRAPKRTFSRLGTLMAPAVDTVGEVRAGPGENGRGLTELRTDDADAKSNLPLFQQLERREEVLGVLIVLPAGRPEDSQRSGLPFAPLDRHRDARRMNG